MNNLREIFYFASKLNWKQEYTEKHYSLICLLDISYLFLFLMKRFA